MKYTRYNYKKKNNQAMTVIVGFLTLILVAFLIGTGLSNIFMKDFKNNAGNIVSESKLPENKSAETIQPVKVEQQNYKFVVIQNGYFEKREGAEVTKNSIKEYVNPVFIIEDNKIRVISGIFNEEESTKYIELLKSKNVPYARLTFQLRANDLCDIQICEIIKAQLEIFNKFQDKTVKSVQTEKLKAWIETLQDVDAKNKNYNILSELKNKVKAMPKDVTKDNIEEQYGYLFTILKKLSENN